MIPDESAEQLLSEMWDSFAVFSHENFLLSGRGVIGLNLPTEATSLDDVEVMYVVYNEEADELEEGIANILRDYDPKKEMIIQFLQPTGGVRTMRVTAPDGDSEPETLWLRQAFGGALQKDSN